jgi:hypothetical protein
MKRQIAVMLLLVIAMASMSIVVAGSDNHGDKSTSLEPIGAENPYISTTNDNGTIENDFEIRTIERSELHLKGLLNYLLFTEGDEKLSKDCEDFQNDLRLDEQEMQELRDCVSSAHLAIQAIQYSSENEDKGVEMQRIMMNCYENSKMILKEKFIEYEEWLYDWWESEKAYRKQWLEEKQQEESQNEQPVP